MRLVGTIRLTIQCGVRMRNDHSALGRERMVQVGYDLDGNVRLASPWRSDDSCKARTQPGTNGADLNGRESNVIASVRGWEGVRCRYHLHFILSLIVDDLHPVLLPA
jgi:hypothetical protein